MVYNNGEYNKEEEERIQQEFAKSLFETIKKIEQEKQNAKVQ